MLFMNGWSQTDSSVEIEDALFKAAGRSKYALEALLFQADQLNCVAEPMGCIHADGCGTQRSTCSVVRGKCTIRFNGGTQ